MAKLQNTLQAPVTVHGTQQYDLAPGQVVEVDDKTDWQGHPYVKCGALELTRSKPKSAPAAKDQGQQTADGQADGDGQAEGESGSSEPPAPEPSKASNKASAKK